MALKAMGKVKVRFFDDETLEGEVRELDFDQPDFLINVEDVTGVENNETAWVPLSAVKWVEEEEEEQTPPSGPGRKVAIRFLDGEVLRGHVDGEVARHRQGIVVRLHPEEGPDAGPARRLFLPFSAMKAVFYVREFDGRDPQDRGGASHSYLSRRTMAPLLEVLDEMDMVEKLHGSGVLSDEEYSRKRTEVMERL